MSKVINKEYLLSSLKEFHEKVLGKMYAKIPKNQSVLDKIDESGGTLTFNGDRVGLKGEPGENGTDGRSAYEIAVDCGYAGTEADWLESLRGTKGDPGAKGDKGDKGDPGTPGINSTTTAVATASANGLMGKEMVAKLNGIASGAEVNVQADWNATDTGSGAYIKNKPASMPASDVSAWAKASTKPTYTKSEVGLENVDNTTDADKVVKSARKILDATNSKEISLNYGAAGLDTASWLAAWNGYELRAMAPDKVRSTIGAATAGHTHTKDQITDFPAIPSVGNGTITINQGGVNKGSFTVNQTGNTTINLTDNNTTYSAATQSANGLMTAADKKKLDGIGTNANNYVHPTTAGNKHIPIGGLDGQTLKYGGSSGTSKWSYDSGYHFCIDTSSLVENLSDNYLSDAALFKIKRSKYNNGIIKLTFISYIGDDTSVATADILFTYLETFPFLKFTLINSSTNIIDRWIHLYTFDYDDNTFSILYNSCSVDMAFTLYGTIYCSDMDALGFSILNRRCTQSELNGSGTSLSDLGIIDSSANFFTNNVLKLPTSNLGIRP